MSRLISPERVGHWLDRTQSEGSQTSRRRVLVGGVALDPISFDDAVAWTVRSIGERGEEPPVRIVCPNASLVALADVDSDFAQIVNTSSLVVPDGWPLLCVAWLQGTPLRGQIRGVDLMGEICAACNAQGLSIYILGGLPGAAESAAQRLRERNPDICIAGLDCPPIGFENDAGMCREVRQRIVAASPDFLIVALGSPKQERWISENYLSLPVGAILGVGAAVDTVAGIRSRPPVWMRRIGLEWFGRLMHEPARLWRRYLFGNLRFLYAVCKQWIGGKNRRFQH